MDRRRGSLEGLVPATLYSFRVRSLTKADTRDFNRVVSRLVE
jgi:hypothetical protein